MPETAQAETAICNTHRPLSGVKGGSETSFAVNLATLALSAGVTLLCYLGGVTPYVELFFILMASQLVFTVLLEWVCFPRTSALRLLTVRRERSWMRIACREVALLATFAVIALVYWLLPMFSDRAMVLCYYPFLKILVPTVLALSIPYFCFMDRRDPEEEDAYCRVGRAILTRRPTMTRFEFGNYARSWVVKAFWISIMQPQVIEKIRIFLCYRWEKLQGNPMEMFLMASVICFAIDLGYAASGYVLNLKLFNTQTRTAEPTLFGWVVTLLCYWPFWGILFHTYFFKYDAKAEWSSLFTAGSGVWWIWGGAIIALELLYSAATISAGIRFSNLTYRGLWKTGPYRWTKHPAYVFKCVSWWMIYVPFLLHPGADAVRCSLLLVAVNAIYYWRAKTEERHLSHYPEYVAYAEEMNERSIFRWAARLLPFLRYRKPDESARLFAVREG